MNLPEFTAFAAVYTHPYGEEHRPLAGFVPYKSGLTPISIAEFPTPINSDQIRQDLVWESYQITHFRGESWFPYNIFLTFIRIYNSRTWHTWDACKHKQFHGRCYIKWYADPPGFREIKMDASTSQKLCRISTWAWPRRLLERAYPATCSASCWTK